MLIGYLRPVLPRTAEASEAFLRIPPLTWADLAQPLLDHEIAPFKPLLTRIEAKQIEAMLEASKADLAATASAAQALQDNTHETASEGHLVRDPIAGHHRLRRLRQGGPAHRPHRRGGGRWRGRTSCCV